MNKLLAGALAGFAATLPMTIAMRQMQRGLPPQESYPLPPKQITMKVADKLGVKDDLDEGERNALAMVSHYEYGAAMGALYALLEDGLPGPAALKGVGFGLAVWTVSYLGLLPAVGLLRPATEQPPRRNALMITAHVVWGSSMGLALARLERGSRQR
jgi:putative membrane protein